MSRRLTLLSFGLGAWALTSVLRAMGLAEDLAAGGDRVPGSIWLEVLVWLVPALIGGFAAILMVSMPSSNVDPYLARNVRMGVMVALFAVLLSWMLVLFAGYLATLGPA